MVQTRRGRFGLIGIGQQIAEQVEAVRHAVHGIVAQPPRAASRLGGAAAQHDGRMHEVFVVVVEFGNRRSRLVADGREPIPRRHRGVNPVVDGLAHVRRQACQIFTGGIHPVQVVLEQVLLGRAVPGAFARPAAGQLRVVIDQGPELLPLQEVEPFPVLRRQGPQHRGAQEAEVVVVARVADRPAAPGSRRVAPAGGGRVPHVAQCLLGQGRPPFALRTGQAVVPGVVGQGQLFDVETDFEVRVAGDVGALPPADGRFRLADERFHAGNGVVDVFPAVRQAIHDHGMRGRIRIRRVARHRRVGGRPESRIGRRIPLRLRELLQRDEGPGRRQVVGEAGIAAAGRRPAGRRGVAASRVAPASIASATRRWFGRRRRFQHRQHGFGVVEGEADRGSALLVEAQPHGFQAAVAVHRKLGADVALRPGGGWHLRALDGVRVVCVVDHRAEADRRRALQVGPKVGAHAKPAGAAPGEQSGPPDVGTVELGRHPQAVLARERRVRRLAHAARGVLRGKARNTIFEPRILEEVDGFRGLRLTSAGGYGRAGRFRFGLAAEGGNQQSHGHESGRQRAHVP